MISFGSLLFYSCYSVERNCKNFHTGSFEFSTLINGEIKTSYFSRTKDLEIETYEGKVDSARIRWVNDCECILTKLNPKSNQDKRPVQIKILSTEGDLYRFEYSLVGQSDNKQRGTIKKIR
ncbi:MAG: DNA topoisomerase IV [Flavobacteriaceae bacterium]